MNKIKNLNRYQKAVLIFMIVMILVFTVIYPIVTSKVGFEYENAILVPSQENGSMVYSGKIKGQQASFTVSEDKSVVFQYGDKTYGPYTAKEDPTAIPTNQDAEYMTGVELRRGEDIVFRGGVWKVEDSYWLYNEDGTLDNFSSMEITGGNIDGGEIKIGKNGITMDPIEPSASAILELMGGPKLTHKGEWSAWFGALFLCVLNAISILFADELFRWNLAFRIRNVDHAEPSDWEIAERYISWTVLSIAALVWFIIGIM